MSHQVLIGAAVGDVVGSCFEFNNYRATDFTLFADNCMMTDDTVCSRLAAARLPRRFGGADAALV
ncbi:hypothetical protein LVJ83_04085 [Uruburuella testudinis]|uniref:ADP-ribosylglycohydrolase n=1 Tax=Uruburuella testudinis TaxID=1282863 RepID=A0ABY4DVA5_9NEIS|nr:hypothetical protein [Uruburuella testudinis]UOO82649.1 hypothetical protein LVJ83_04085 [Uruburuella testudinis]